jgi:hypothetical protein
MPRRTHTKAIKMTSRNKRRLLVFFLVIGTWTIAAISIGRFEESLKLLTVIAYYCALMVASTAAVLVGGFWVVRYLYTSGQLKRRRQFQERMRRENRFFAWDLLKDELLLGKGTLIMEVNPFSFAPLRLWWTGDKLLELAPVPPPSYCCPSVDPPDDFDTGIGVHPFVTWCANEYLDAERGRAQLTDFELKRTEEWAPACLQESFPKVAVVLLPFA